MGDLSPCSTVLEFIQYVNDSDLDGMASLISEEVKFTDIQGRVYREKEFMAAYLARFPEYQIHVQHALRGGQGVAIVGQVTGSHLPPDIEAKETLVWTAEIQEGRISTWRIYAEEEAALKS